MALLTVSFSFSTLVSAYESHAYSTTTSMYLTSEQGMATSESASLDIVNDAPVSDREMDQVDDILPRMPIDTCTTDLMADASLPALTFAPTTDKSTAALVDLFFRWPAPGAMAHAVPAANHPATDEHADVAGEVAKVHENHQDVSHPHHLGNLLRVSNIAHGGAGNKVLATACGTRGTRVGLLPQVSSSAKRTPNRLVVAQIVPLPVTPARIRGHGLRDDADDDECGTDTSLGSVCLPPYHLDSMSSSRELTAPSTPPPAYRSGFENHLADWNATFGTS